MRTKEEILALRPGARVRMPSGWQAEVKAVSNETVTLVAKAGPKTVPDITSMAVFLNWQPAILGAGFSPPGFPPATVMSTTVIADWQHLRDSEIIDD